MKNLKLGILLLAIAFITSCGSDDGADVELGLSGSIAFDGTTTELTDGLIFDFGVDAGEYNYDFYLANGAFSLEGLELTVDGNTIVYLELFNQGSSFSPGTFSVAQSGERYCNAEIRIANDISVAEGGTVTISGSGQTYDITFNLEFSDSRTLTGTVGGAFGLN